MFYQGGLGEQGRPVFSRLCAIGIGSNPSAGVVELVDAGDLKSPG
jgi:hypothetical protein